MPQRDAPNSVPPFDPAKRYVRLTQVRADGFVEFEFAIGDPELAVDLILPADAYRDFCRDNHAVLISPLQGTAIDRARLRWSTDDLGDPG
jgi:phenol/toluene 2-monooxygenase (NADH) P0/A0